MPVRPALFIAALGIAVPAFGFRLAVATALLHVAGIAVACAPGAWQRRMPIRSPGTPAAAAGFALLGGWT